MEYIFFRKEGFYTVHIENEKDVPAHIAANPGTIRVENMFGIIVFEQKEGKND